MMKQLVINVNGTPYPCRPSMGAMLRFKQETGKEVTEMNTESFSELCTYLWCCVVSGSKRQGLDFNLSLMEFADALTPEDMADWQNALAAEVKEPAPEDEKKSR